MAKAQPQDHKPKKAPKTTGMFRLNPDLEEREIDGWHVEVEGITVFVPEESLLDYDVTENMAKMRSEGRTGSWRYPLIIERMFGVEQKQRILEHLTVPETGRVDQERLGNVINGAFQAANPNG